VKARWIEEWNGALKRGEISDPRPGDNEVLITVEACGVGLTVLNCIRGDLGDDPDDLPRVPGHELVGQITDHGPGVDPTRVGERVAAYFYLFCGRCPRCLAGQESLCTALGGFIGVDRDGGYAERVILPARNAIPLPGEIDPVSATAIPDAISTPVHVADRARIVPGDRVAVIAAGGGVGVHMAQVARLHGADVVGMEASPEKLTFLADELRVQAVDSSDFERVELPTSWDERVDVVVDLLGRPESLQWSHGALDAGGRMVVLTTFPDVGFAADPRALVFSEASIMGSRYASRYELLRGARLVAEGSVRPVVSEVVGPDGVDALHDALRQGSLIGRGALSWS
jgi:D-arabinose 1-dehydrogenase-like Zn-dependent alcohol dehydrogenase